MKICASLSYLKVKPCFGIKIPFSKIRIELVMLKFLATMEKKLKIDKKIRNTFAGKSTKKITGVKLNMVKLIYFKLLLELLFYYYLPNSRVASLCEYLI